jgi:hypothetical protein
VCGVERATLADAKGSRPGWTQAKRSSKGESAVGTASPSLSHVQAYLEEQSHMSKRGPVIGREAPRPEAEGPWSMGEGTIASSRSSKFWQTDEELGAADTATAGRILVPRRYTTWRDLGKSW